MEEEEGPHWCLPARFYSSTSISMWASHRPFLLLLAFHHSCLPPSVLASCTSPTCVYSMCVFGCFGSPAGCVGSGRRRKRKKREELMGAGATAPVEHDSVWMHQCPWGKKHTKHVPKTHCCRPSCNQCVQMDTFPHLTSISMSLIPAAWSSYNSSDRRATGKLLVQRLFGLSCTKRELNVCCAPSLLQSLCCALALRMRRLGATAQTGLHNRGWSVYSPRGGGALAHLFKQPEISWGNENFHLCRTVQILHAKSPFTSLARLTHCLLFPQLNPGASFPA